MTKTTAEPDVDHNSWAGSVAFIDLMQEKWQMFVENTAYFGKVIIAGSDIKCDMNKKIKKELRSYGIMALVALFLYVTGWHTVVISYLQRGLLATGIMRPKTELLDERNAAKLPQPDLNVQLADASGQIITLEKYRGKVLFINLWATWCPPCLAEMPNINQLYEDMGGEEDLEFFMIATDQDFSKAVQYADSRAFAFPIYQIRSNWPQALQSNTLPTTFVIDKAGRLVLSHRGMAKYNTQDFKDFLRGL